MMWGYDMVGWFWMVPVMLLFWGVVVPVTCALGAPRKDGDEALKG